MGTSSYSSTAFSVIRLRDTLLYWDRVIPLNIGLEMLEAGAVSEPKSSAWLKEWNNANLELNFLCDVPRAERETYLERITDINEKVLAVARAGASNIASRQKSGGSSGPYFETQRAIDAACGVLGEFIRDYDLQNVPFDIPGTIFENQAIQSDPVITISNLKLVDTSRVSWGHIAEFRRDREAKRRLRRLRLFAFENYAGKSKSFIEDDFGERLDAYDQEVKKWGFEVAVGSVNTLLGSKAIGSAIAGSFLATLVGQPIAAQLAAASSVVVGIGRCTIELTKQRLAFRELVKTNPASFVSYANTKLRSSKN